MVTKSAPEVPGGPSQTLPLSTQLAVRRPVPRAEVRRPGFGRQSWQQKRRLGSPGGDCGTWHTAARGFSKQGSFLLPESAAPSRTHFRAECAATALTPRLRWNAAWNSASPSPHRVRGSSLPLPGADIPPLSGSRVSPSGGRSSGFTNTVSSLQPLPELLLATC